MKTIRISDKQARLFRAMPRFSLCETRYLIDLVYSNIESGEYYGIKRNHENWQRNTLATLKTWESALMEEKGGE